MADKFALSDVLEMLGRELRKANDRARAQGSGVMEFEECEVEFAVEVEKSGNAGIQIHFLSLGGGMKKSEHNTVRVKFKALEGLIAKVGNTRGAGPALQRKTPRRKR